ncbi:zinc-binding dehydrogenase, partial [Streptomyces sp. NPDC020800]|uniref:zinc-binding dehydrogenase n=1 Tax=Streptomyces sp. NPDC020800 TaxID=3365092 RepID=UPI00379ED689
MGEVGGLDLPGVVSFADLGGLVGAVEGGGEVPEVVVVRVGAGAGLGAGVDVGVGGGVGGVVRGVAVGVLGLVREWLGCEVLSGSRLLVVTERAVDGGGGVLVGVGGSSVWGLVRVVQAECPGRVVLADVDDVGGVGVGGLLRVGVGLGEGQFVVRLGEVRVARLVRGVEGLRVPGDRVWCLGFRERGTLENLTLMGADESAGVGAAGGESAGVDGGVGVGGGCLGVGEVRVALRAAGVNFRDVLNVLGMYPGDAGRLGLEGAGVVVEVGPGVVGLCVGDAVMGLFAGAFSNEVVTDQRLLVGVPSGWSWAEAAASPVVFLTAWYALVELAGLGRGERVLVHAAAGGVGIAAVQLAGYLGAEVYATASPSKWGAVRGLGVEGSRIASSRTTDFEGVFRGVSGGCGMDVVLDSLAGEFVDASLRLTRAGGRFVEMGKTDVRDAGQVARDHGVVYRAFDLLELDRDLLGGMLGRLSGLFAGGVLRPLPVACWDVRRAVDAFRFLSQARHVGKVVLTVPALSRVDCRGTVLVTGASGALGGLVARHLAGSGRVERLVLVSR